MVGLAEQAAAIWWREVYAGQVENSGRASQKWSWRALVMGLIAPARFICSGGKIAGVYSTIHPEFCSSLVRFQVGSHPNIVHQKKGAIMA
jgi:hypothetical protein